MPETRTTKFKRLFPWADPKYADFPWADPEELNAIKLSGEAAQLKEELVAEYITPYNLAWLPGYVLKELVDADREPNAGIKHERLKAAQDKAQNAHLAALANGRIKNKDEVTEPMSEDVKEHLRDLNEKRKAEKAVKKALVEQADKTINIKESKVPDPITKVTKKAKKTVFNDPEAQAALIAKYSWCIPGSFVQDAVKPGLTLVSIKCQKCGNPRQIHLADLFHVQKCVACKKVH